MVSAITLKKGLFIVRTEIAIVPFNPVDVGLSAGPLLDAESQPIETGTTTSARRSRRIGNSVVALGNSIAERAAVASVRTGNFATAPYDSPVFFRNWDERNGGYHARSSNRRRRVWRT